MKNLYTVLLLLVGTFVFGQLPHPRAVYYKNFTKHLFFNPSRHGSLLRGTNVCDSYDLLDYCSYSEVLGLQQGWANAAFYGLNNGQLNNGNPIYVQELSAQITAYSATQAYVSYAAEAFDTLAFDDYPTNTVYGYPLAASTITLQGINFFYTFSANENSGDSSIANDSLVFRIYPINNAGGVGTVSLTADTTIVVAGDSLKALVNGDSIGLGSVSVGYTFNQGQGFLIRVEYLDKDTSTHFSMCMSFVDSCGPITITYQGQQYPGQIFAGLSPLNSNVQYPAEPINGGGTNSGLTFFGQISNNGGVMVNNENNTFNYEGLGISPTLPLACAFSTNQNFAILPVISVCVNEGAQITSTSNAVCAGNNIGLSATLYGSAATITGAQPDDAIENGGSFYIDTLHIGNGNNSNLTYLWSASAGGTISSNTSPTPTVTINSNSNVTVTVVINDGTTNTTDSIVLINCALQVSLGSNQSVCTASKIILSPAVTGGSAPYTYAWQSNGDALNCPSCANPSVTLSQNSVYTVTVTDAVNATATATVSYSVTGTVNSMQLAVANTVIHCNYQFDTTTVTVTGGTAPYSFYWGNGATANGASPQSYNYGLAGQEIIGVTDANGCITDAYDTILYQGPDVNLVTAIQPSCPGTGNGEIIISVSGGTPPYSLNWNTGSTSDSILNAVSGSYLVWVNDSTGCYTSFSYTLNPVRDEDYYVYLNSNNPNCNAPGAITSTVTGGILPYTFNWSNGSTAPAINPINSGAYQVTVTDSVGCSTTGTVYIQSTCVSLINGVAFVDSNGNCTYGAGATPLNNLYVIATSSTGDNFYGLTDGNGNYSVAVTDTGTFNLSAISYYNSVCGNLTFCGNTNQTVYLPVLGDTSNNNNIGFVSSTGFDLGIHPGWTSADPGFTKQYWVYYYNSSYVPFTGAATITFVYDPNLTYINTDEVPAPVNDNASHTLTWHVDSVPGEWNWFRLDGNFQVPSSLSLNYLLQSDFTITPFAGDCDISDNHYHFSETVIGSHDPNEKTVEPAGALTENDSILTYTIHFQNTGTDSTHFIIIKDTLSSNLDPASVRNIASSDKYSGFTVSGKGILTWTFNPLRVVDSFTNPSGSKRFITFQVKRKGNLPIGATIDNTASVYFDYNTPVVTNTVADTIANTNYIFTVPGNSNIGVKAFPNPFNDVTNIVVSGIDQKFGFELYDVTGRLLQAIPTVVNNQFQIHRDGLAGGVYLYRIIVGNNEVAYGKLVVQ